MAKVPPAKTEALSKEAMAIVSSAFSRGFSLEGYQDYTLFCLMDHPPSEYSEGDAAYEWAANIAEILENRGYSFGE